jgi:hypothetical protein
MNPKGKPMGDSDFYSKKNPLGPYAAHRVRTTEKPKPENYIEGQSTRKSLEQWAEYSRQGSHNNPEQVKSIQEK